MAVEEERQSRGEVVHRQALLDRRLHICDPRAQRERHLLHRRAALLAEVVARDRDRVPPRHPLLAVLEQVRRQPHRGLRRIDVVAPRYVLLEHIVLGRSPQLLAGHPLLLAHQLVKQQQAGRGCVDRHRRRHLIQRDALEGRPHVVDRVDRHPRAPHLPQTARVVRVKAELGGQVERHRQPRRALRQQVFVALVRLLRRRIAGVLAHRPSLLAVHLPVGTPRVGELPRLAQVEVCGEIRLRIELIDLDARVGEAARILRPHYRGHRQVLLVVV